MKTIGSRRQDGATLIALLAIVVLATSWMLVDAYGKAANRTVQQREHNARVLAEAKAALVAWVAINAFESGENNPGRLPCPQYWGDVGTANEGRAGASCILSALPNQPAAGWLPWRTLGLPKLTDASGAQLWYVVSPGWASRTDAATLTINSNSVGQLTVDGQANAAVGLIIAPGSVINESPNSNQINVGCGTQTQNQTLNLPSTEPNPANFLDCQNGSTTDGIFVTSVVDVATRNVFNDQVTTVTTADILPALEAAIAKRIEREILPELQTVYTPATWGFTGAATTKPVLPFAAPFASPGPGAGTSDYVGAVGTYQGLLPFNQVQGCSLSAADPRCALPVFAKSADDIKTAGSGSIQTQSTCSWQSSDFVCTGEYLQPSISVTVQIKAYVATGLRTTSQTLPWTANSPVPNITFTAMNDIAGGLGTQNIAHNVTASPLGNDGSVTFTIVGDPLPDIATAGWGTFANYRVSINSAAFGDHALLNPVDPPNQTPPGACPSTGCTGWFVRNEWYRLLYYAVSQGNTAVQLPSERSCSTPANCLTIANLTPTSKSAILIVAGRSVNGSSRPGTTLADYLEFGNTKQNYEKQIISHITPTSYADTGAPDTYMVAVASLATGANLQFKATNANTGASTLSTSATGTRSLVNADGSNLAAGTIQANAAVQVTWDGTQFLLSKRPFNDRFAVLAGN